MISSHFINLLILIYTNNYHNIVKHYYREICTLHEIYEMRSDKIYIIKMLTLYKDNVFTQ